MIDVKNASNNGMNCLNGSYPLTLVIMNQKKEILEKLAFIRRHKEFASFGVKEQEVSYNPCLSEEDIKEFEHKHCITLPDDYRTFISEIGNGGFGPGYGLYIL